MTEPYYVDEHVTLYHGDCRVITDWLTADVLVTDPPYGYDHASNWEGPYKNQPIQQDESVTTRDAALTMWADKPALVFGSWKSTQPTGTRAVLVWDKGLASGMGDLKIPWKPNWEAIYVLGTGFHGTRDSGIITGNVVTWASKGRDHPMQKPEGLLLKLLDKCPPGMVADPFAGSGTSLAAAKRLGRRAIGVEIEERYCELTARRLDQGVLTFEGTST